MFIVYFGSSTRTSSADVKILHTDCRKPASPENGIIILDSANLTTYGSPANVTCDMGYDLIGNNTIRCEADGQWSNVAECVIKGKWKKKHFGQIDPLAARNICKRDLSKLLSPNETCSDL